MLRLSLGNLAVHILADNSKFMKVLRHTEDRLDKFSKQAQRIGRKMSLYLTAPLAAIGGASVRAFGNFDDAMTQSLAIMEDVTDQMRERMEDMALDISGRSITAPRELARAYYYLASAGLDAERSVQALATVEKFAVAGMFDMAQATDLLTDAQSALGMTVKDPTQNMKNMVRISDTLVRANTLANASVEQFSRALTTKAASALRLLNKDVEEGVAVLAAFADQGVKGELAGERLHIVMRDLQRASLKEANAWRKMGLTVYDTTGKMLPLADIIEQLESKFSVMSDQQKKSTAQMLGFQDRSFSALQTLIGTSRQIRKYEVALRNAGGTTDRVSRSQLKSFNSQMKILWNRIVMAGIEIGRILAPWVRKLANYLRDAITWFRGLDQSTRKWIVGIGIAVAALGPLLVTLGLVAAALKMIITLVTSYGVVALKSLIGVTALTLGVLLFVDAVTDANLGVREWINNIRIGTYKISTRFQLAFVSIWKAWDWLILNMSKSWWWLKNLVIQAWGTVERAVLRVFRSISNFFWTAMKGMTDAVVKMGLKAIGVAHSLGAISAWQAAKMMTSLVNMKQGLQEYAKDMDDIYNRQIKESLRQSENAQLKHYQTVGSANEEFTKQMAHWAKVRAKIIAADQASVGKGKTQAAKALGQLGLPSIPKAGGGGMMGAAAGGRGGTWMSGGQFRETSLRRFSLAQPAPTRGRKQAVQDEAVAGKLDQLYQLLSDRKAATAVLG